ncbi:hypothetical protein MDAP_000442 [Mitosporidium daphniae]
MASPFEFLNKNGYHHHFCACLFSPLECLLAFFIPCILTAKVKATLDKKDFDFPSCFCWPFAVLRNRLMIQDLHKDELKEDSNRFGVSFLLSKLNLCGRPLSILCIGPGCTRNNVQKEKSNTRVFGSCIGVQK